MAVPSPLLRHAAQAHEQAAAEVRATTRELRPLVGTMLAPVLAALTGATDYQSARKALLRAAKRPTPPQMAKVLQRRLERGYAIGERSAIAETA